MHDIITAETHKQQYSSILNEPNQVLREDYRCPIKILELTQNHSKQQVMLKNSLKVK